jgi:hypothetical protein
MYTQILAARDGLKSFNQEILRGQDRIDRLQREESELINDLP